MIYTRKTLLHRVLLAIQTLFCCLFLITNPSCGNVIPNDPIPSGTVIAQGTFTGANGKSVSGAAIIYSQGSGQYVLRLQSLSAPSESGLQIVITVNSTTLSPISLLFTSGTKNYSFTYTGSGTPSFTQVSIKPPGVSLDYGIALLTAVP